MGDSGVRVEREPRRSDAFARALFTPLAPRYDRLAALLSMGQDPRWRRAMIDRVVGAAPTRILDVACGPGAVARQLARRTGADVVGIDLTESMVREGRTNVESAALGARCGLAVARAQRLPFPDGCFDALTFTYLLRYVDDPAATLKELARVLRPGGVMASVEFLVPPAAFWQFWWRLYTRVLLPVGGWLTGGRPWWRVGRFLGPDISRHYVQYPLSWTIAAWQQAGMENVEARTMSLGGGLVMFGARAGG